MSFPQAIYPVLEEAKAAMAARDPMTAWRLTTSVLEQHPDHLMARHLSGLATAYIAFGDGAEEVIVESQNLYFKSGGIHLKYALALEKQGEADLALVGFKTAALIDFHQNPALKVGFGGAFNGQMMRKLAFQGITERVKLAELIETGTHRGTTTEFMARYARCKLKTTEISPYFLEISRLRFADLRQQGIDWADDIELHNQDSRTFLTEVLAAPETGVSFFYLDAHGEYLEGRDIENPLVGEVRLVRAARRDCIVMIDDFEVPGDGGYAFEKENTLANLAPILPDFDAYFSPITSKLESGDSRGSILLSGSPETTAILADIGELRRGS